MYTWLKFIVAHCSNGDVLLFSCWQRKLYNFCITETVTILTRACLPFHSQVCCTIERRTFHWAWGSSGNWGIMMQGQSTHKVSQGGHFQDSTSNMPVKARWDSEEWPLSVSINM